MNRPKSFLKQLDAKLGEKRTKPLSIKNPVYVFDPPQIVELRRELQYHPELVAKLGNNTDDIPTIIGILAATVDIAMDGNYTTDDLLQVTDMIINRLREKRGAVLIVRTK